MMCGGASETKDADKDVQAICDQVCNFLSFFGTRAQHSLLIKMTFGKQKIEVVMEFLYLRDKENPSLVFSGDREIPTRESTVPVGNEASPSFPLER